MSSPLQPLISSHPVATPPALQFPNQPTLPLAPRHFPPTQRASPAHPLTLLLPLLDAALEPLCVLDLLEAVVLEQGVAGVLELGDGDGGGADEVGGRAEHGGRTVHGGRAQHAPAAMRKMGG